MKKYVYVVMAIFLLSCVQSHTAVAEIEIGPGDPRFEKEMNWFELDVSKGTRSFISMQAFYIVYSTLRPFVKTFSSKEKFRIAKVEDRMLLDGAYEDERNYRYVEYFYVVRAYDKIRGFDYYLHLRTRRDTLGVTDVTKLRTEMLYVADRPVSTDLFYRILPIFLKSFKSHYDVSSLDNVLRTRNIHIEHVPRKSSSREVVQLWTLYGAGNEIAQSIVIMTPDGKGGERIKVRDNKGYRHR